VYLTFVGSPGPPKYITGDDGGNLTISPADNILNCSVANNPAGYPAEECSLGSNPTATSYLLYMTYPSASGGSVTSNTLTLTVQ
jgi:hypothetical protein